MFFISKDILLVQKTDVKLDSQISGLEQKMKDIGEIMTLYFGWVTIGVPSSDNINTGLRRFRKKKLSVKLGSLVFTNKNSFKSNSSLFIRYSIRLEFTNRVTYKR